MTKKLKRKKVLHIPRKNKNNEPILSKQPI